MQNVEILKSTGPDHIIHSAPREAEPLRGSFFEAIGRPDLRDKITPRKPYTYLTMEFYGDGLKGGGGLGVLAGDTRMIAQEVGMPLVVITPFYTGETHQEIHDFKQHDVEKPVSPTDRGFAPLHKIVRINTKVDHDIPLGLFEKKLGSTRIVTIADPDMRELYHGANDCDHRLFQETAAGFGGHKAIKELGLSPSVIQLNEAPTVFTAIGMVDDLVKSGKSLDSALSEVRNKTLYTNHTLVQAVEAQFNGWQFDHFVMPNIESGEVQNWIWSMFKNDRIRLSTLAIELSKKRNGVSKLHAEVASQQYQDARGELVGFQGVTNGIAVEKWVNPGFVDLDRQTGVVDEFGLPTEGYEERINSQDVRDLRNIKKEGRRELTEVLARRVDQYGRHIDFPEDAMVLTFKRRFVGYKRAEMLFHDPKRLADMLNTSNGHLFISGKAHPADRPMQDKLAEMLRAIDGNETLKKRVHYMPDYDEELGRALSVGADISLNTPVVGKEACGTSFMKDIANRAIIVSTNDGGIADRQPPACLPIQGESYLHEVDSLYNRMNEAAGIIKDDRRWKAMTAHQLSSYPNIFGAEMVRNYINYVFPNEQPGSLAANTSHILFEPKSARQIYA